MIRLGSAHCYLRIVTEQKKEKNFCSSLSVSPQVVPVSLCVPGRPDFRTLVWLWSSKNVASQNQGEKDSIS
jgi:hypothetical protein